MGTHPIFESDFDCLTDDRQIVACTQSTGIHLHSAPGIQLHSFGHALRSPAQSVHAIWRKLATGELLSTSGYSGDLDAGADWAALSSDKETTV